ncbi:MAG: ABC transporter permease [Gemmatimonadota bacterium]
MPINRRVRAVMRREYLQRVRSKWFLFSTLVVPVLILGIMVLPVILPEVLGGKEEIGVGVIDRSGTDVQDRLASGLAEENISVQTLELHPDVTPEGLADELPPEPPLQAYLFLPADVLESRAATLVEVKHLGASQHAAIRRALREAITVVRLAGSGIEGEEASAILRPATLDVEELRPSGRGPSEIYAAFGFVFAMMLYMMFIVYGQMIARGVIEEKTSNIVEIMVSSVRPWEMMLGKIVGVGAVGLTQVAIWGVVVAIASLYGLSGAMATLSDLGLDLSGFRFPLGLATMALLFFVLGYLLYASLFASAGAMLSNEQDVQQVMMPVLIPIVIPIMLMPAVLDTPDASWAVIVSLVPFFSPILLMVRLAVGNVPVWQSVAAIALLVLTILGTAWVAGRIYRVGILMKGKRPNLPELVRWVRYG